MNLMQHKMRTGVQRHRAMGLANCVLAILGMDTITGLLSSILPAWTLKVACLAGILYLGAKLLAFRRWSDETRHVPRFLFWFLLMIAELSVENCVVWLVSASDRRKYEDVPGLQDNVELAIHALSPYLPGLAWFAAVRWVNVMHFLLALLALAFSPLWDQVPYSGFGLMSRVVGTIATSRLIRMVCFMSTVLPSPRPGCYARRFPPVPDTMWGTILAGYTTIRGFGGCNDLIFSGHGAFWVLAPLAHQTYYRPLGSGRLPASVSTGLLWVALAQASLRDVVERHHYSVDMILAVVVTWACWTWLEFVYPASQKLPQRPLGAPRDRVNPWVLLLVAFALVVAAVIVIGGKA